MDDLSQFLDVYLEELDEQLNCIEEEVLRLEREGASESGIQRLFRAAHTLKGSSAAMGFAKINELTHEMEHLLDRARNGELSVSPDMTDLFFSCLDGLKRLQAEIVGGRPERSDIGLLVKQLREFAKRSEPEAALAAGAGAAEAADPFRAAPEEAWRALQASATSGRLAVKLRVRLADACEMKTVRAYLIDVQIRGIGAVVWSDLEEARAAGEERGEFAWLLTVDGSAEELKERVAGILDVEEAFVAPAESKEPPAGEGAENGGADADRKKEQVRKEVRQEETAEGSPAAGTAENAGTVENTGTFGVDGSTGIDGTIGIDGTAGAIGAAAKPRSQTIRVQVDRLEHLMNLVGELVIDQTRMQQVQKLFRQQLGADDKVEALTTLSDHLTRTIGELQQSVMKVRMLPVDQLFNRFPRMVRDTARTLGKEVELVIEGKDTELDRTIIDEIGDPLTHLIRNALDHGLEAPEDRAKAGKPRKGTLRIGAVHEDNQVVLSVEDDGAGIRADRIRSSAVAKGIVSSEEAAKLSDPEAVRLIFRPGFSTASQVSEISGRGVGMDIVRTEIERMNGTIEIDTEAGRGTRFLIRLPLTLAIITGLLVNAADREFILPMSSVAEIVRTEAASIRTVNGSPIARIRDQVVPIVWLHDLLGLPGRRETRKQLPLVIVGRMENRLALAVDELIGNQEVVIKSLGSFIGQSEGISGATILGNGKVALILDTADLLRMAGRIH